MTDTDKDKDKPKPTGGFEERRVKPGVILRRIVKPPEPLPKEAKEPVKETLPQEAAVTVEPKKKGQKGYPTQKVKSAGVRGAQKKVVKKETKAPAQTTAVEAEKCEVDKKILEFSMPIAAVEEKAAAPKAATAPHRKEVKVFEKESPHKKSSLAHRPHVPHRKGRHFGQREVVQKRPASPHRTQPRLDVTRPAPVKKAVRIVDAISVGDLSQRLGIKASEIIRKLMDIGIMATVNQLIDFDTASLVSAEFGFEVESAAIEEETLIAEETLDKAGAPQEIKPRPPVVTVMGHVDHGKTSLLDAIRKTNVAAGEAGGITQHIGAYHVHLEKGDITFLDTPGHEAFTAMRARGARATDIVVLVVAADDGVMPQTVEAINHAKAAGVPIIVAINKIDLPQANLDRIRNELASHGLVPETWGGETLYAEISAKNRIGIKELLDKILVQAEVLELKSSIGASAKGIVVEAKLDKGRGPVATILVRGGTLKVGDAVVTGVHSGRVRAMINDWGKRIQSAGPAMPVEILGLSGVPEAGDSLVVVKDEVTAKQITVIRQRKFQEKEQKKTARITLADLYDKINKGEVKELKLVIKSDVHGSIEAVKDALLKLSTDKVTLNPIHMGVGGISEGDVMLASASDAIVIGFNVRPEPKAAQLAQSEGVDVRLYEIIYNLIDDIKKAMEGLLSPIITEKVMGRAEIRDVLRITKVGNIAGSYVTDGKAMRGAKVRLIRDNVVIYDGRVGSLRRFKEDVREVSSGYECGITIEGYNDIKVGDSIEFYILEEEAAKL
ncbi:MAG: translation initiation factor IF-2, partial [Deltaproteobacteria bacterium]|nr:translation initiation factor IF-2 [Deltaproteobacteria bacterium]